MHSTKKHSDVQFLMLWPELADRYNLPSALILGYMFWWCVLSNKARKSSGSKKSTGVKLLSKAEIKTAFSSTLEETLAAGLVPSDYKPKITLRKSYTALARLTGLSRSVVIRSMQKLSDPLDVVKIINETKTINRYQLVKFPFQDVLEKQKNGTYRPKTWLKIDVEDIRVFGDYAAALLCQIRLRTSNLDEHGSDTWWGTEDCRFHLRKFMGKATIHRLLKELWVKGALLRKTEGRKHLYRLSLKSHQLESQNAPVPPISSLKSHHPIVSESQIAPRSM